jgi:pyruvate/2-oxoglutarate dehydrogenase complex dihydrolipoamide acyltransferase (E2) component
MPLFSRPDGTPVKNEALVRRIMPYIMPGRIESMVLHEARYDLTRTLPWLAAYNETHERKATLFHLLLFGIARALHERPGLNRFVTGQRLYQRNEVSLSFAAKKEFTDKAAIVTVKVDFPAGESFSATVERVAAAIAGARGGKKAAVDTELKLAFLLPGFMVRLIVGLLRWLDGVNLLPAAMIKSDPLYCSTFVANLGSIGINNAYHHLYEYGTASLFAAVGQVEKQPFVDPDAQLTVRDGVKIGWAFDERIADGFYCVSSLAIAQKIVEDPANHVT